MPTQRRTLLLISSDDCGWADLRRAIAAAEDLIVVGETTSADRAVDLAATLQPDVIVAAATVDGVSIAPRLIDLHRGACPRSKIIVFAKDIDPDAFIALDDVAMAGYLLWNDLTSEILRHCLAAVTPADIIVGSRAVVQAFIGAQRRPWRAQGEPVRITETEPAVLRRLAEGLSREEIAAAEGVSVRTVARAISGLETKLGAPNRFVLGQKANALGLIR